MRTIDHEAMESKLGCHRKIDALLFTRRGGTSDVMDKWRPNDKWVPFGRFLTSFLANETVLYTHTLQRTFFHVVIIYKFKLKIDAVPL